MTELIWLTIALPLFGSATLLLFGRRLGQPLAGYLASTLVALSFLIAVPAAIPFAQGTAEPETINLFSWIPVLGVDVAFLWDPLAALMTLIVTGVGAIIHFYAIGYMEGDERFPTFFGYLNLFVASMLILVLAANFAILFVGWELVGLCSYLLISFWFVRPAAAAAGKKAFVVNRIGDWGFLIGLMLIFASFGSLSYATVFSEASTVLTTAMATAITLLLFTGAVGKSAQIPLYVWLPDAMEGPTPVSALIHAATMVTAGVFMVARTAPLFELAPFTQGVVATVGAVTAFYAATIALGQRDIKRVLAYSTISQLGYMILAVGIAAYTAGMFHLLTHAFFKALLFLGAGSVLHAMSGEQDMWKMGGLRRVMPITFATMVVGWLAISGLFPLSGFWSKDEILGATFSLGGGYYLLWALGVVTVLLTAYYMTRLIFLTFMREPRWAEGIHPHESPAIMTGPLLVLAGLSIFAGAINTPWRLGLEHFLEPSFAGVEQAHPPGTVALWTLALISLIMVAVGIAVAYARYLADGLPDESSRWWRRVEHGYYIDDVYGQTLVVPGKHLSQWTAFVVDAKVVDGAVNWAGRSVRVFGAALRPWQSGWVRSYALGLAAGTFGLLLWLLATGGAF